MRRQMLPHDGKPSMLHPIIHAAFAANGIDAGELASNRQWHDGDDIADAEPGRPYVHCSPEDAQARWAEDDAFVAFRVRTTYEQPDVWIHEVVVHMPVLPSTVVNAAPGMKLGGIVSVPGGDELTIVSAEQSQGGMTTFLVEPVIIGAWID